MNSVTDRVPATGKANRKKLTLEGASSLTTLQDVIDFLQGDMYGKVVYADDAVTAGTAINKALFDSIGTDVAKIPKMITGSLINTVVAAEETHEITIPTNKSKVRFLMVINEYGDGDSANMCGFDLIAQEGISTTYGVRHSNYLGTKTVPPAASHVAYPTSQVTHANTISNVILNSATGKLSFKLKQAGLVQQCYYSVECYS